MPRTAPGLDRTGQLDGAAEQQQLFRQRGLAGVRVGNDRKRAAPGDFRGEATGWRGTDAGLGHEAAQDSKPAPTVVS